MKSWFKNLLALGAAILLCAATLPFLQRYSEKPESDASQTREALYLPNGDALEFLTFGNQKVLAHILWFNTINYFAKHWRGDRNYLWLEHMCNLVTKLNPRADYVYQFCGVMLSWEGNKPEEAVGILTQAINNFPDNWLFYYLRGFNLAFFLHEEKKAKDDFVKAASLPGAHPVVISLASRNIENLDSPENAVEFLNEALRSAEDEKTREVLLQRIKEIYLDMGLKHLQNAVSKFKEEKSRRPRSLEELVDSGYLLPGYKENGFRDPLGGRYYLDSSTGTVLTTSKKRKGTATWKRNG